MRVPVFCTHLAAKGLQVYIRQQSHHGRATLRVSKSRMQTLFIDVRLDGPRDRNLYALGYARVTPLPLVLHGRTNSENAWGDSARGCPFFITQATGHERWYCGAQARMWRTRVKSTRKQIFGFAHTLTRRKIASSIHSWKQELLTSKGVLCVRCVWGAFVSQGYAKCSSLAGRNILLRSGTSLGVKVLFFIRVWVV